MQATLKNLHSELVSAFQSLSTDQQLAVFWFIYKEVGKSITPAAPGASTAAPAVAEGLFNQVKELSHEEQLKIQRDLIERTNCLICREYGALSDTTKLLFWYLLAQGMDATVIIPMSEDYALESAATQCMQQLQQLDFSEQMTVLRSWVSAMGVDPSSSPHDKETGL